MLRNAPKPNAPKLPPHKALLQSALGKFDYLQGLGKEGLLETRTMAGRIYFRKKLITERKLTKKKAHQQILEMSNSLKFVNELLRKHGKKPLTRKELYSLITHGTKNHRQKTKERL
ncbi:MAG: hypothetical protein NTY48_07185 [Candidatus Diapherotrites archaeon]|nr:hypothetical protein [Candidatus Diapherotrites archaeon]